MGEAIMRGSHLALLGLVGVTLGMTAAWGEPQVEYRDIPAKRNDFKIRVDASGHPIQIVEEARGHRAIRVFVALEPPVVAGPAAGPVHVIACVCDRAGTPLGTDDYNIDFSSSAEHGGEFSGPASVRTVGGKAETSFLPSGCFGDMCISAALPELGFGGAGWLRCVGAPSHLCVRADPPDAPALAGERITVTAWCADRRGTPVEPESSESVYVTFEATIGGAEPVILGSVPLLDGAASIAYEPTSEVGCVHITVKGLGFTGTATANQTDVVVQPLGPDVAVGAKEASAMSMSARVTDLRGNPLKGHRLSFRLDRDILKPKDQPLGLARDAGLAVADADGVASVTTDFYSIEDRAVLTVTDQSCDPQATGRRFIRFQGSRSYDEVVQHIRDIMADTDLPDEVAWEMLQVAHVHARYGKIEESIKAYNAVVARYPDGLWSAYALKELADMFADLERYDDAVAAWQRILTEYPNNGYALMAPERIWTLKWRRAGAEVKDPPWASFTK
jgi:hypothetical protein